MMLIACEAPAPMVSGPAAFSDVEVSVERRRARRGRPVRAEFWGDPARIGTTTVAAGSPIPEHTLEILGEDAENLGPDGWPERPTLVVEPLYHIRPGACANPDFPRLAGAWVVWCSAEGGPVDRAWSLVRRETWRLDEAVNDPVVAPGLLYRPDLEPRLWRLPLESSDTSTDDSSEPSRNVSPSHPPGRLAQVLGHQITTDGIRAAYLGDGRVETWTLGESSRQSVPARPTRGSAPAIGGGRVIWEEGAETPSIWALVEGKRARYSADGARRPVGSDAWLGWVEPGAVVVDHPERSERRRFPAETGFEHPPSLWGPVVCWEDRTGVPECPSCATAAPPDIELRCSDGLRLERPGHQRMPQRYGPWLLFREGESLFLATASAVVLDDDDPRADDGGRTVSGGWGGAHRDQAVRWTLDWPTPGWRVERWDGAGWVGDEAVATGTLVVESGFGDAVRLVPGAP